MATKYEYYDTGADTDYDAYGAFWKTQTFTPSTAHTITSVKLLLYRVGSPGTLTVGIHATGGDGKPTGADLCSGTTDGNTLTTDTAGAWYEITLGAGAALSASTLYAIVVRATGGDASNKVIWRADYSSPTYANGASGGSTDSGGTWTLWTDGDLLFEEWGEPAATEKTSSDTGSGAETLDSRLFGAAETGSGIGVPLLLTALIGTEETGLGSEFAAKIFSAFDSGIGAEAHLARLLAGAETGSALEAAFLIKQLLASDYGLGGEAITSLVALVIGSEAGSGWERFGAKIVTSPGAFDMRLSASSGEVRMPSKEVNL